MKPFYEDIISRIPEEPKWWDENGVPRYCEFEPGLQPYTDEAALVLIACQSCGREFKVSISVEYRHPSLTTCGDVQYGDPPNGCSYDDLGPCSGMAMSTDAQRILEFWSRRNPEHEWKRLPEFEVDARNGCLNLVKESKDPYG